MNENEHKYQIFVTPTFNLNFLLNFCEYDIIIQIISIKFHSFNPLK